MKEPFLPLTGRRLTPWMVMAALMTFFVAIGEDAPKSEGPGAPGAATVAAKPTKGFDGVADSALATMKARAEILKIQGVAVVAYFEGDIITSWSSKMVIVGSLKNPPSQKDPGVNLLAIAYSKAAEMADTLKASGSGVRQPMKGEYGWQGGLVKRGQRGYCIAAFSGGKSEDDVTVSQAGIEVLTAGL